MSDPGSAFLAPSIDVRTAVCPACGHEFPAPFETSPDATITTLLAVCDVLVVKALEKMGFYIIRGGADRGRWREFDATRLPVYAAHTIWGASDFMVSKALKGAWDVVPLVLDTHGPHSLDAEVAVAVLDQYVHDLVVAKEPHNLNDLAFRLRRGLGLPVFHVGHVGAVPRTGG